MPQMLIRPTNELKNKLQQIAAQKGIPVNSLVNFVLWDWVKREERSEGTQ